MQAGSIRDGIFGQGAPRSAYGKHASQAYADGVLGLGSFPTTMRGQGRSFRDGIFSQSAPHAAFQSHSQQAYADGVLGMLDPDMAKKVAIGGAVVAALAVGYVIFKKK